MMNTRILVMEPDDDARAAVLQLLNAGGEWSAEALEAPEQIEGLSAGTFQLVIVDLRLARTDDHALLRSLLQADPHRPVLLTGADGQVQHVVEALQAGAAGFIHTAQLASQLIDNVERVTGAAFRNQIKAKLLHCMTSSVSCFSIENDPLMLPTLLTRLQYSLTLFGICDDGQRTRVGIALEEALSNALYHGNLEVSSALRNQSIETYYELAGERRFALPYSDRRIHVTEELTPEYARFTIRDEGPGFDTSNLDTSPDEDNLEAVSGRGLLVMRSFMDQVSFNARGNQVTLTKYKTGAKLTLAA
jgi:anti-sigma regulatory factor (Ser/Thr protein kinase)/DNA-binding NarL/FixJ family response regulator